MPIKICVADCRTSRYHTCMAVAKRINSRLEFRLHSEQRSVIEQAASVSGQSLTDFAISSLIKVSEDVLNQHQVRQLSNRDRDLFLKLLDDNSPPNAALKSAAAAYRKFKSKH